MNAIEFIQKKFPVCKNRMDSDILNGFSGKELVELLNEYTRVGENDVLHSVINCSICGDTGISNPTIEHPSGEYCECIGSL